MKGKPRLALKQEKGQVTIPAGVRNRYGFVEGGLVAITEDGIKVSSRNAVAVDALERSRQGLPKNGVALEPIPESGEEIREEVYRETCGGKA